MTTAKLGDASPMAEERKRDVFSPRSRGGFLRAAADFQTELFRVMAGFVPALARWELRRELPALIFRDARRVQELRKRCAELNTPPPSKHLSAGVPGADLIRELCAAPDAPAALEAVFAIVKPRLHQLLEAYLEDELRVFDAPSIPVVEANKLELERQIAWVGGQPESKSSHHRDWLEGIKAKTNELDGLLHHPPKAGLPPVIKGRKMGNLPIQHSVLPDGFREAVEVPVRPAPDAPYSERERFHAHNFFLEVQAADSCASLLFEAPDMPWEFYFDCARHMWDETRHCEFGEIKLKSLGVDIREAGISNVAYVFRQTLDPIDRYAALTTQEADAFPGKHAGLKDAMAHHDDLSARAWSYDIADETQHVRYGHKWIPVMIQESGDPRSYEQIKRDAENWRRDVLAMVYTTAAHAPIGKGNGTGPAEKS